VKPGAIVGKTDWKLTAKIDGHEVGDSSKKFEMFDGMFHVLLGSWSKVVKISSAKTVKIEFAAKESSLLLPDDYGSVTHTLRWPFWQTLYLPLSNGKFEVAVRVLLSVRGKIKHHAPNEIFAARTVAGKLEATTVSGTPVRSRIEICEVRPLPPVADMPKRLPVRGKVTFKSDRGINIKSTDPINVLPNPPVIPIIARAKASKKNAARIEVTFYQPDTLAFTVDDARLTWKVSGAGAVDFIGKPNGLRVHVYGTRAGDIKLQLHYQGSVAAEYRGIVKRLKKVKCRVNLLDGGVGYRTKVGSRAALGHILVANRYLRQVGVRLSLDASNATPNKQGATSVSRRRRGIFRVQLPRAQRGDARNVGGSGNPRSLRYNFLPKVLNIVYLRSLTPSSTIGRVYARPANMSPIPAGKSYPQMKDSGSPSTSWIKPSGVWPAKNAKTQTMECMDGKTDPAAADLWALALSNGNSGWLQYGYSLAHEVGHMLGLAHRESASTGDLLPDSKVNVMYATNVPLRRQDLDVIQARAVHNSPMLT
jgi:hypothetical protein